MDFTSEPDDSFFATLEHAHYFDHVTWASNPSNFETASRAFVWHDADVAGLLQMNSESLTTTTLVPSSTPRAKINYPTFPTDDAAANVLRPLQHGASQSPRTPNLDPSLDVPSPSAKKHRNHDKTAPNALPHPSLVHGNYDMLPPPASTHATFTVLHDFAQDYASHHGYAFAINTTAKNRSRIKLTCVCYGVAKNTHKLTPETRVRKNRQSAKTDCKMWIEGRRLDDGSWALRVGEPAHNHAGRPAKGWAVQRKRTWGAQGGKVGVGGVIAREELEVARRRGIVSPSLGYAQEVAVPQAPREDGAVVSPPAATVSPFILDPHSHARGSLVWKIVEQEMERRGENEGRDRGCGRTVKALQERLPGIEIFKRDVYNIRAQIKRTRKDAGVASSPSSSLHNQDLNDDGEPNLDPIYTSA
ncbi:hypothetical protein BU16DRAFT_577322 [Lophium mytilinum]|uniref:FAR1 domain-containing protein n=1 Tax=Lophium mytilinum TaxID=390894 RepID=A0A6A6R8V6_9PEZI|nr:hypothetical protein BU16DRAFT_577322 [Lophium mytilinum]